MAYKPFYQITDWQNIPVQKTSINRTDLLRMENGVKEADNRVIRLDTEKLEKSGTNLTVRSVVVDVETGVITVTLLSDMIYTYGLDIGRVIVNFDITDDNIPILILANGAKRRVDLTRFVYSFSSTTTIMMKMVDRKVMVEIVNGSVIMAELDSSIRSTFLQYPLGTELARDLALQYQKNVKRCAVGDTRFDGSKADNVECYCDQSRKYSEIA